MFLKYINIRVFLVSLAAGLLFVYLSNPDPTVIYVYPTPDNVNDIKYKDRADNCFKFDAMEVPCPTNKGDIKTIPLQK
jgi:hypothetical protein